MRVRVVRTLAALPLLGSLALLRAEPEGGGIVTVDEGRRVAACDVEEPPPWTKGVARLVCRLAGGQRRIGTAVLVAPDLALTALHNVAGAEGPALLQFGFDGEREFAGIRRTAGNAAAHDAEGDWVLLRLDAPVDDVTPLTMAEHPLREYDRRSLLVAGYSADAGLGRGGRVLTWDAKCRLLHHDRGKRVLETDAVTYPGASGGPAFVRDREDAAWHWIGINHASTESRTTAGFRTFVVHQDRYREALAGLLRERAAAPVDPGDGGAPPDPRAPGK